MNNTVFFTFWFCVGWFVPSLLLFGALKEDFFLFTAGTAGIVLIFVFWFRKTK